MPPQCHGNSTALAQFCTNVASMPPNVARTLQDVHCRMSAESLKTQTKTRHQEFGAAAVPVPCQIQVPCQIRRCKKLSSRASCDAEFFAVPNSAPPVPYSGPVPNLASHITCDAKFWRRISNSASHIQIRRRDHKSRAEFRRRGPSGLQLEGSSRQGPRIRHNPS